VGDEKQDVIQRKSGSKVVRAAGRSSFVDAYCGIISAEANKQACHLSLNCGTVQYYNDMAFSTELYFCMDTTRIIELKRSTRSL
jgi:hypothetical protein